MSKIRVLIVDDSAIVRQILRGILEQAPDIEVMDTAADPIIALEKMQKDWPDVISLDIEMPRMDGITFLRKIMSERPTPVVICSSFTERGAKATIDALAAGALSIITKPKTGMQDFLTDAANDLVSAVRAAARSNLRNLRTSSRLATPKLSADAVIAARATDAAAQVKSSNTIAVIGASTGGTQALETILRTLPVFSPPIAIVQHMPEKFTAMFAERLNTLCRIEVREARDGDLATPGRALIAPGGKHMLLSRNGSEYTVKVIDGAHVNRHRPSVDVLFRSAAQSAGCNALGIILTGMGDDGALGLLELHKAGAKTVAQDEASCVVYGMPKEAVRLGGVDKTLSLDLIAREIMAVVPTSTVHEQ